MQDTFYTVAGCPLRIALVTDLHEKPWEAVLDSLRVNRPDLICAAGDFVYARPPRSGPKVRESGVLPFFRVCAGLAPCYVSLGNHEWMITAEDEALLKETGARVLDNAFEAAELGGARLVLGGLTSARVIEYRRLLAEGHSMDEINRQHERALRGAVPKLEWLDAFCAEPGCHILLCHQPEYYPRYLRGLGVELILSGHAHGGQIRIRGRGLFAPGQGFFPELTSGVTDGRLVISRGLANCQLVPRVFNPPEVVYILPG